MTEIRDMLGLDEDDHPNYSTIYKSFDQLEMCMRRALLRVSAQQHPQNGYAVLDNKTLFETVFSVVKCRRDDAVRAQSWYRKFREVALRCTGYKTSRL